MCSDGVIAKQLARAVLGWMGTAGHLIWPSFITEKEIHCNSLSATGGLGASDLSLSRFLGGTVRERIPVAGYDRRAAVFFKEHERLFCPLIPLPQPQRPETDIIFSKNPKQIFQRLLFASEQFDH